MVDDAAAPTTRGRLRTEWRDGTVAALLGTGMAVVLSVGSWVPSLWTDETATISGTQRTWPQLWYLLSRIDAVHGLYYALVKLWSSVVPLNAFTLRLPSLLAIGAATALVYLLARTWLPRSGAVAGALIFGLLPRSTWMAIEGRSWAIGTLVAVAATLVLVRWVRNRRPALLVAYLLLMAFGMSLNIYLVFLAIAHGISLLVERLPRRRLLVWLAGVAASGLVALPVVLSASREKAQLGDRDPLTVVAWLASVAAKQFTIGDTPGDSVVWVPERVWLGASLVLAATCWALLAFAVVRAVLPSSRRSPEAGLIAWALPWLVVPPVAVLVVSLVGSNLYHPRYFGFTVPAFALAAASGLCQLPRRWLRGVVAAVLVLSAIPVQVSQRDVTSKAGYDWSLAAAVVHGGARANDGVYFSTTPPTRSVAIAYPTDFTGTTDISLARTPADDGSLAGASLPLDPALLAGSPDRVWGLWSVRSPGQQDDLARFASAGYREVSRWTGPETTVVLLER